MPKLESRGHSVVSPYFLNSALLLHAKLENDLRGAAATCIIT